MATGEHTGNAARAERVLVMAFVLFRVGGLVQVPSALVTGFGHYRLPWAAAGLGVLLIVEAAAVVAWFVRRRGMPAPAVLLDAAFCCAGLLAGALLLAPEGNHTWAYFMYPFSLLAAVGVGVALVRPAPMLLATGALAACYLIAELGYIGGSGWNEVPNTISYFINAGIAWLLARELWRSGRSADEGWAVALARAEEMARDKEMNRYSRMLHDRVLQTMEILVSSGELDSTRLGEQLRAETRWLRTVVEGGVGEQADDLVGALHQVVAEHTRRGPHVDLTDARLRGRAGLCRQVAPETVAAISGAVRELLTNVRKHAGVNAAVVSAGFEDDALVVSVADEGTGFEPDAARAGTGLARSVRGRLEEVGGTAAVDSAPGAGTYVELVVPVHVPATTL
jgi:signal transduction histidine kinase